MKEEKIENCCTLWTHHTNKLRLLHETSESNDGIEKMNSEVMNVVIGHLYNNAKLVYQKDYQAEWPESLCLIALDAYGRNELAPHGTVNLMLLYVDLRNAHVFECCMNVFHQEIIYALWDLKITVTTVFMMMEDVIEQSKKSLKTKNAQLDARLICGSADLFRTFQETFKNYIQNEPVEVLVNEIIEAKSFRHKQYHDTMFLLEPDINLGVGGLKDYRTILQLAEAKFKATSFKAIEYHGLLSNDQIKELTESYNFLNRVRNELQLQNSYDTHLLHKDQQLSVAWALGYKIKDHLARVNVFMKDYYKHVQCIHNIEAIFEEHFKNCTPRQKKSWFQSLINKLRDKNKKKSQKQIDGFILANNILTYASSNVFIENPLRLVRVFNYAQQYRAEFSLELKILIRDSLGLMTEEVLNNGEAHRCLCTILQTVGEVYNVLKLMHELKVLGYLIPEFKEITHLVRHDYCHQYTVDIHTLNTVQALDEVFQCKKMELKPYYHALQDITEPWLLYLILLLHDLGKAHNIEDPFERSAKIAKRILDSLQINQTQQGHILFSISNLVHMALFWQKYDVDDPNVFGALGMFIGDIERLSYLYIANYCDIKGTAMHLWNSYKAALHTQLFENIRVFFSKNKAYVGVQIQRRKDRYRQLIHEQCPEMSNQAVSKILALYSDDYFRLTNPRDMELQIPLLEQLSKAIEQSSCNNSSLPIVHWQNDDAQQVTIVRILSWNHKGLLAKLAAAFFASKLHIVNIKVFTQANQIMMGTFHIHKRNGKGFLKEQSKRIFHQNLNKMLADNADLKNA